MTHGNQTICKPDAIKHIDICFSRYFLMEERNEKSYGKKANICFHFCFTFIIY